MSSSDHQLPSKTRANIAAEMTFGAAVALAGRFAAFVSFRWQPVSLPLTQSVISAVSPLPSAVQFSGKSA